MYELKTNTAVRIPVGPLVDPTDGKTAETSLTVTDLSVQLYQIKNDGSAVVRAQFTPTASGGNNDMALVSSSTDGMYDLELTATQLNWLGCGRISFYDVDGFLVHWIDISIVSAAYFNWKYGSTIPDVNVSKIGGTTQTARDIGANVDVAVSSRSAAGAKMDLVDAPNATAVAAIQSGLALDSTVMKSAGYTAPPSASDIASAVWSAVTRTLTAFSDSSGITTLLSRIGDALSITDGKVDINDKTGFALADGQAMTAAKVVIDNQNNTIKLYNVDNELIVTYTKTADGSVHTLSRS